MPATSPREPFRKMRRRLRQWIRTIKIKKGESFSHMLERQLRILADIFFVGKARPDTSLIKFCQKLVEPHLCIRHSFLLSQRVGHRLRLTSYFHSNI